MGVQVRVPAMFGEETILIAEPVATIGDVLTLLARMRPGLTKRLGDPIVNYAVNDEMLLHDVRNHPLKEGDVIEIVPAISGGQP